MKPGEAPDRARTSRAKKNAYAFMKKASSSSTGFDLNRVDAESVRDAVYNVTAAGDMISFTLTSDGGAICVSVTSKGERHKAYASTTEDLEDLLTALSLTHTDKGT